MKYSAEIERDMKAFYDSLSEKDRRRSAALEAAKLGQGGTDSIATVLGCDPKTIRHGQHELATLPDPRSERVRRAHGSDPLPGGSEGQGADASGASTPSRSGRRTSCMCCGTTPRATRCVTTSEGPI